MKRKTICLLLLIFFVILIFLTIWSGKSKKQSDNNKYSVEYIRDVITPIAKRYQIKRVYLFGSYARGDYNKNSDVDLRIDKGNLKGLFVLCGFYTDVSEALQLKVDVLTTGSLEEDFLERLRDEEVLLYNDN